MTSHVAAGQLQQRPTARESGLFKREWFGIVNFVDETRLPTCRAWDLAATAESGDFTVGIKMGIDDETGAIYVLNVVRGRWSLAELEILIKSAAGHDGEQCVIRLPQDPGRQVSFRRSISSQRCCKGSTRGPSARRDQNLLAPTRSPRNASTLWSALQGDWNQAFIDELCAFPIGRNDDQVDAVSAAFRALSRRSGGITLVA